jgi:(1->4)-alpha-D-glucan 1-alpha-D-glucosylmutase
LLDAPDDGELKMFVTWRTLCFRQQQPALFQRAEYLPLLAEGAKAKHVVAFARTLGTAEAIVVAPRLVETLMEDDDLLPMGSQIWQETRLLLPRSERPKTYRNLFTDEVLNVHPTESATSVDLSEMLSEFPLGLFVANT